MPSPKAVLTGFGLLDAAAIPRPKGWRDMDVLGVAREWANATRALDDGLFITAVRSYIASGERWWPTPGTLLKHAPVSSLHLTVNEWHPAARAFMVAEEAEHGPPMSWLIARKDRYTQALIAIEDADNQAQRDWILERYAAGDHVAIAAFWRIGNGIGQPEGTLFEAGGS